MKNTLWCMASAMLLTTLPVLAQSNNNADGVVKIDRHATRDYREGEMIVKFKESAPVRVKAMGKKMTSGVNKVDQVFSELGVTAGEQLMPLTGHKVVAPTKARRGLSGKMVEDIDLSQLYCLTFDEEKVSMEDALEKVTALEEVEYAEPNYIIRLLTTDAGSETFDTADEAAAYLPDPLFSQQWGPAAINLPRLWAKPKVTEQRPVIAIIDTGLDITHPDLAANLWTNEHEADGDDYADDDANGLVDDVHGWDFIRNKPIADDRNGHGTHCAGIAAAVGNNGIGITGANTDALILPIRVLDTNGSGDVATLLQGMDYAVAQGADVISMSLGGSFPSSSVELACKKAYQSAYLVAAAGNNGKSIYVVGQKGGLSFPAAYETVIGVMASNKYGNITSFSNYDPDGPYYVDYDIYGDAYYNYEILAPGEHILSTYPGGKYKSLSGTSMATPLVAGALSRLLQTKEAELYKGTLIGDMVHAGSDPKGVLDILKAYQFNAENRATEVLIQGVEFDDAAMGDGDGFCEAGEIVDIYPVVRCLWGYASNIRVSVSLDSRYEKETAFEVLDNNVELGNELSSMAWVKSKNPIRIKINSNMATGYQLHMLFTVTADNVANPIERPVVKKIYRNTDLGGVISGHVTLYPDQEYMVSRHLVVDRADTLTIKPGTTLKFKPGVEMRVLGTLECVGTPDSLVRMEVIGEGIFNIIGDVVLEYCYISDGTIRNSLEAVRKNCVLNNTLIHFSNGYEGGTIKYCNVDCADDDFFFAMKGVNFCSIGTSTLNAERLDRLSNCNMVLTPESGGMYFGVTGKYVDHNPNYYGTSREDILRKSIYDLNHPTDPQGYGILDLSNMVKRPVEEAHAIVWKVLVNGVEALDEHEQLLPLGVGTHQFDVYFSRPMDTSFAPKVAMGAVEPYNQVLIAENGSWNADGTVYTVYLTLDGKTDLVGMNRISVADAVESSEDYYLRKDLTKVKELIVGNVPLQAEDASKEGYLMRNSGRESVQSFVDGDSDTWAAVYANAYFTIDLGEGQDLRCIQFHGYSDYYTLQSIIVQGSHDGQAFHDVYTYNHTYSSLDQVSDNRGPRYSYSTPPIDAGEAYRYYRLVFHPTTGAGEMFTMFEFGMRSFVNLGCVETRTEMANLISTIEDLCASESRDIARLREVRDQIYATYNALAETVGEPTIEQPELVVPHTPDWVIPTEKYRFNVNVQVAGSLSTHFFAEAGLGKVKLTWETDEEDFADLLGYNIYRYTEVDDSVSVRDYNKYGDYNYHWEYFTRMDTTIVNPNVLESDETEYTDYDVIPGTTYYYFIKQLTTSLTSHALSNAVAATPLTAQKGDANGSMNVDIADVVTEVAYITFQDPQPFIFEAADVNSDEEVDILDVVGTLGIIINPAQAGVSSMDDTPVNYFVKEGVLYVENTQPLGGVQVRLHAQKGTEFTVMDGLDGMEQTCVWTADDEFLLLAYSMSGHTIMPGTHALLKMGDEAVVTQIVLSDAKGGNVTAVNGTTTGIDEVKAGALNIPTPNPFTTYLNVPYVVGLSGDHEVDLKFCDLSGRVVDAYSTIASQGKYNYTWQPRALQKGLYMVALYVDGQLVQSAKVICAGK